jgi:hypothetical protein
MIGKMKKLKMMLTEEFKVPLGGFRGGFFLAKPESSNKEPGRGGTI